MGLMPLHVHSLIYLKPIGLIHGALVKEYTSVSLYYPPNSHHCRAPGVLCSLKGLKCTVTAISSTSDGLTALRETETR